MPFFFFFFYKTSNKNEVKQFPYFKLPVKMSQHRKGSVCLFGWFFFFKYYKLHVRKLFDVVLMIFRVFFLLICTGI